MAVQRALQHSIQTSNLADLLERILDKGIVIAGDIRINLVEVELLTLQIRLVICSVEKAREIGIDWWTKSPAITAPAHRAQGETSLSQIEERLSRLENAAGPEKSRDFAPAGHAPREAQ